MLLSHADCNVSEEVVASCCPAFEARRLSGVFHMHHKPRYFLDNLLDMFVKVPIGLYGNLSLRMHCSHSLFNFVSRACVVQCIS